MEINVIYTLTNSKDKVSKSDLEIKLKESIADESKLNYLSLVEEIAEQTHKQEELEVIKKFINKKLNSKKWKRVLKVK